MYDVVHEFLGHSILLGDMFEIIKPDPDDKKGVRYYNRPLEFQQPGEPPIIPRICLGTLEVGARTPPILEVLVVDSQDQMRYELVLKCLNPVPHSRNLGSKLILSGDHVYFTIGTCFLYVS